nr:succinate--hydroxymethylglutarate CoA-transferase-like [Pogona vitticeps]
MDYLIQRTAFKTKDGYIVVGAGNDQQFATVCKILNLSKISHDPRYKNNQQRVLNRKELIGILSARFLEEETTKWLELFEGSGVPYGPINSMKQVFTDPQVLHNGLIMEMNHPTVGKIAVPGSAIKCSQFEVSKPKPPPLLGQHTVDVLKGVPLAAAILRINFSSRKRAFVFCRYTTAHPKASDWEINQKSSSSA